MYQDKIKNHNKRISKEAVVGLSYKKLKKERESV
jgi:hypothetical protein